MTGPQPDPPQRDDPPALWPPGDAGAPAGSTAWPQPTQGNGPLPPPPVEEDHPLLPWRKLAFLVPVAVLAFVLYTVRMPYFVLQPGPATDVVPLIRIDDHPVYPTKGHLLLTAVNLYQPNVYEALWAWIDDTQAVVPERDILLPGETQQEEFQRARSEMGTSQIDAAVVALTKYAGYPDQHGMGVLVENVLPDSPADGKLFPGDLIVSIDGQPVDDTEELGSVIQRAGVGHSLAFQIEAGGETHRVDVAPAKLEDVDRPAIGILAVNNFPFPVDIKEGEIGGPSAGLMWTLGLIDLLTPGELTGGKTIAGTGTVDLDGNVGPIGGISQKVVAAERAGAVIFFAPAGEAAEARAVADHIVVVPVDTFQDAVNYLEANAA